MYIEFYHLILDMAETRTLAIVNNDEILIIIPLMN